MMTQIEDTSYATAVKNKTLSFKLIFQSYLHFWDDLLEESSKGGALLVQVVIDLNDWEIHFEAFYMKNILFPSRSFFTYFSIS